MGDLVGHKLFVSLCKKHRSYSTDFWHILNPELESCVWSAPWLWYKWLMILLLFTQKPSEPQMLEMLFKKKLQQSWHFFQSLKYKAVFAHEKSGQDIFPVVVHDTYHTAASDKFIPLKIVNVVLVRVSELWAAWTEGTRGYTQMNPTGQQFIRELPVLFAHSHKLTAHGFEGAAKLKIN